MIDGIVHWWRIGRLQRQAEGVRRFYLAKLRSAESQDEKDEIASAASHEEGMLTDEIDWLLDRRLTDLARRRSVPVPDFDVADGGPYERSAYTGRYRLTRPELHKLRSSIRAERKEAFESWSRWVALVLPIVSLVISVLALLRR